MKVSDLRVQEMLGKKYGKLTPFRRSEKRIERRIVLDCKCECGNTTAVTRRDLLSLRTKSCGCFRIECKTKHGMHNTKTYHTWENMIQRCTNPKNTNYCHYGANGVKVCERWRNSFENFLADMGERPPYKTIDRIDCFGNYEPSNCRWATRTEQDWNMRKHRK